MGIRSILSKPIAAIVAARQRAWSSKPGVSQAEVFGQIIRQAAQTRFAIDHDFKSIRSFRDFQDRVPVREYEALYPYVKTIIKGESDILWPGTPGYFSKK